MVKEAYIDVAFKPKSLDLLDMINSIIDLYMGQGLRLTLRQLYYQLVTRNTIPNQDRAYKNLGKLLSQGRLAGMVDWEAIEDRLRKPHKITEWRSPQAVMEAVVDQYRLPMWDSQPQYVELWVEKDALAGVLQPIVDQYRITLMVNRGYSSQSAMKESARRFARRDGVKGLKVLYIGDQDPSGEDMVRDVDDRLTMLARTGRIQVVKLAITEAQVAQFNPPPNPTKMSDSRAEGFVAKFGSASYEADALPPDVLAGIARGAIEAEIDQAAWAEVIEREDADKELLRQASDWIMSERGDHGPSWDPDQEEYPDRDDGADDEQEPEEEVDDEDLGEFGP